jgi:hypothetical protein
MTFVRQVDEMADDFDLQRSCGIGKHELTLIEGQHELEKVLEQGLRDRSVRRQRRIDALKYFCRITRREVVGDFVLVRVALHQFREHAQSLLEFRVSARYAELFFCARQVRSSFLQVSALAHRLPLLAEIAIDVDIVMSSIEERSSFMSFTSRK